MSKKLKIIVLIISIILIASLATFAWFIWNSKENTELTMTIGNLAEVTFTTGNDISEDNMGPVLDYQKDGELTTFSIKNKADYIYYVDIILNIDNIDNELKNNTFKYVLLESNDNNSFNEIKSGDFTSINTGSNIIYNLELDSNNTKYYKFIMYIDGNMENDISMMNKSISGYISVSAKCPECGGDLIFEGGCNTCKNCGYSKCD